MRRGGVERLRSARRKGDSRNVNCLRYFNFCNLVFDFVALGGSRRAFSSLTGHWALGNRRTSDERERVAGGLAASGDVGVSKVPKPLVRCHYVLLDAPPLATALRVP